MGTKHNEVLLSGQRATQQKKQAATLAVTHVSRVQSKVECYGQRRSRRDKRRVEEAEEGERDAFKARQAVNG